MWRGDAHVGVERFAIRERALKRMAFGFHERDRSSCTGAGVNAFLHFHAEVVSPPKFLRRHEFNAHFLCTVGNSLFELKVLGAFDGRIP